MLLNKEIAIMILMPSEIYENMLNNQDLKTIILDQAAKRADALIEREIFKEVDGLRHNSFIVVITGIRRCGKSSVLQMVRNQAKDQDFFLSFDDDRLAAFVVDDFQRLLECFIELYGPQQSFYLDEIQLIPGWERFVRRLHDAQYKIYITGSNATLFSKELGTRLTGRYVEVEMYPFSFREFVLLKNSKPLNKNMTTNEIAQAKQLFSQFIREGGLPEYLKYQLSGYLHTLFENILYKDIITRYNLPSERVIKQLANYLASNIAKDTSYSGLAKILNSNAATISDYCQYFEKSYLFFSINRFSPSLKNQMGYHKKTYSIDTALAQTIGFRMSEDAGRMLENVVYLELKRHRHEIYFYREKKECDFIVKTNNEITMAIQVTMSLNNPETKARELAGLLEAMQQYKINEGLILTDDEADEREHKINSASYKIHVKPVWRWLIENNRIE